MMKANEIENKVDSELNPVQDGKKLRDLIGSNVTRRAAHITIFVFGFVYLLFFLNNLWYIFTI